MTGSAYSALLAFGVVVALIPLLLRLLKRMPIGGSATPGLPRVVAMLPLGANQRVLTVEVGQGEQRLWLVLGVSPGGINTLHTMTALPASDPAAPPHATSFAQVMKRLHQRALAMRSDTERAN